jgi:alpha-galactosidase
VFVRFRRLAAVVAVATAAATTAISGPRPHPGAADAGGPAIHGPRVVGSTPGRPFLFLVPATGDGPLAYSARNLPAGLSLDEHTGIISGSLRGPGTTEVELTVRGAQGDATRKLTIVGADHKLALTPPMGWNSWNVWGTSVDADKIRQAADWMVKSGLAAHGFRFINIDDAWEAGRDANGEIQPNAKFGDMKALADYVHSKGLLLGIYSSPGPLTCGGYAGSFGHEEQDAATYARWGIDYLKYDWCSYQAKESSLPEFQKPYRVMRGALDKVDRDITFSFCQYGMGDVWEWGTDAGGNLWRTTGDITDQWSSLAKIGFRQNGHEKFAGPGHWNDPDMLVVGKLGWGPHLHPTGLTADEQATHITLWSMLAAPLLIGCDLSEMDRSTLDLLTNDEVLDIDQDPLGKQAWRCATSTLTEVWARPLSDGTIAVALFNRDDKASKATVKWADLGIGGSQPVRDLWQRKDVGTFGSSFSATVPAHGTVLVKVGQPDGPNATRLLERYDSVFAKQPIAEAAPVLDASPGPHKLDASGFIRHWLVVGPFPCAMSLDHAGLATDYLGGEEAYEPARGKAVTQANGAALAWGPYASPGEIIDFLTIPHLHLPNGASNILTYSACWIESDRDMDVQIRVGSDDGYKLWIDHEQIGKVRQYRASARDQETYPRHLTKGRHLVMIKVDQGTGGYEFLIRVVTPDGQPAPVRVRI